MQQHVWATATFSETNRERGPPKFLWPPASHMKSRNGNGKRLQTMVTGLIAAVWSSTSVSQRTHSGVASWLSSTVSQRCTLFQPAMTVAGALRKGHCALENSPVRAYFASQVLQKRVADRLGAVTWVIVFKIPRHPSHSPPGHFSIPAPCIHAKSRVRMNHASRDVRMSHVEYLYVAWRFIKSIPTFPESIRTPKLLLEP